MSILNQIQNKFDEVPESLPLIPEGSYNALFNGATEDEENNILRLHFILQDNPGLMLSDGQTPVDGNEAVLSLWLPKPEDWERPPMFNARYPSEGHRIMAQIKRTLKVLGITDFSADLDASLEAAKGIPVVVAISHRTNDAGTFEQVKKVMPR